MGLSPDRVRPALERAVARTLQLQEPIGSGAFAVVFRAHDPFLQRDVAVKVLDPDFSAPSELLEQFLREARMLARVEHPHIVPLYAAEAHEGLVYLVMRLLHGTLAARMAAESAVAPAEATRLGHEISMALAAAHERGVVHRDVKPANVLIDGGGHAIVTDFGISRLRGGETGHDDEKISVGTPGYMSPEQICGEAPDGKSDVYSVGVILFELLAGRPPFNAKTTSALLQKHLHEMPPSLADINPRLPSALVRIVASTLEKDAAKRPSAAELVSQLEEARNPDALLSPQTARWRRYRHKWPIAAAIAIVGGLALAAYSMALQYLEMRTGGEAPYLEAAGNAIPAQIIDSLQKAGAVEATETPRYVFVPRGPPYVDMLVVTDRALVLFAGPSGPRRFPWRSGVTTEVTAPRINPLVGGLVVVHVTGQPPDTVLSGLSGAATSRLSGIMAYTPKGNGQKQVRVYIDDVQVEWVSLLVTMGLITGAVGIWSVVRRRRSGR